MLGWLFLHPWPLKLRWAWWRVQGWNMGDVLGKGWPRGESGNGTPGNWAWLSAPGLDSWARGSGEKHLQGHSLPLGHHLLQMTSATPISCCSLWTPDSASPSPKSRTSYFWHQEKNQAIHLLNSFLTLKLLCFVLNPLFFPDSLCSFLF